MSNAGKTPEREELHDNNYSAKVSGMSEHVDAYPELERDLQFYPLGIENPTVLTSAQIDHYNDQGYLFPIPVFNEREMIKIREYFDVLLQKALAVGWSSYEMVGWHKSCRGVYDIVTNSHILDVMQDLLGDTVILQHSHFFVKLAGDGKRVSWHQDASYWPLSRSKVVSAWLAIDDSMVDNGAMQVIPGSHKAAQIAFHDSQPDESNVLTQTVRDADQYGDAAVPLVLKAGEMSLHSDWTLHGSDVNQSKKRRCGLAMRFLSSDVQAYNGWNAHSVICRGKDSTGHWANHARPMGEQVPSAMPAGLVADWRIKGDPDSAMNDPVSST
jgi:non-heme Fe2+,alpha-ketoglutarate-dependent halogenase